MIRNVSEKGGESKILKLIPGMTVQTPIENSDFRVAHCVKCGWTSLHTTYVHARDLASTPQSHACIRKVYKKC